MSLFSAQKPGLVFWLKLLYVFDGRGSNPGPPRPLQHVSDRLTAFICQRSDLTGHNRKMIQILSIPLFIPPPTFSHERADLHNDPIIVYLLSSVSEG